MHPCHAMPAQVRDPQSKTPSLVFEYVNNTDFKARGLTARLYWWLAAVLKCFQCQCRCPRMSSPPARHAATLGRVSSNSGFIASSFIVPCSAVPHAPRLFVACEQES